MCSDTMKPCTLSRERKIKVGAAMGIGAPLYPEIMPHNAMRPNPFIRSITASMMLPPTFSKCPSIPLGVATLSAA